MKAGLAPAAVPAFFADGVPAGVRVAVGVLIVLTVVAVGRLASSRPRSVAAATR